MKKILENIEKNELLEYYRSSGQGANRNQHPLVFCRAEVGDGYGSIKIFLGRSFAV